jgi:hypothetical protein
MRHYSEAVKADVRRRMSPPMRQPVARISLELGIHIINPLEPERGLTDGSSWCRPQRRRKMLDPYQKLSVAPETDGLDETKFSKLT